MGVSVHPWSPGEKQRLGSGNSGSWSSAWSDFQTEKFCLSSMIGVSLRKNSRHSRTVLPITGNGKFMMLLTRLAFLHFLGLRRFGLIWLQHWSILCNSEIFYLKQRERSFIDLECHDLTGTVFTELLSVEYLLYMRY